MTNWNVKQALNQTEDSVGQGSTVPIKRRALATFRANDDDKVLTLARMVGAIATYSVQNNVHSGSVLSPPSGCCALLSAKEA